MASTYRIFVTPSFFLCMSILLIGASPVFAIQVGDETPDFTTQTFDGTELNLKSFRGKVVLVNFWASWCIPCRQELPFFAELQREYASDDFAIIAVNIDKKREKAEEFIRKFDLPFYLVRDEEQSIVGTYKPPKMPSTFFVDRQGTIRFIKEGFHHKEKDEFRTNINVLLQKVSEEKEAMP